MKNAQKWIVIPGCSVSMTVDNKDPVQIGFQSPEEALIDCLKEAKVFESDNSKRKIKIEQVELNGITLAYALEWDEFFQEWTFLDISGELDISRNEEDEEFLLGTCIEGIRIEFETPGFKNICIASLANAVGVNSPKTNVVRSGLEVTPQRDALLQTLYKIYCGHIKKELHELYQSRAFSLTWAVFEATLLLLPISENSINSLNTNFLNENIKDIPLLLVERKGRRKAISPMELAVEPFFWMIDCMLFRSAEWIIREVPSEVSLSDLIQAFHLNAINLPDAPLLCSRYIFNASSIEDYIFEGKEVDIIRVYDEQRRVDLRWAEKASTPRWLSLNQIFPLKETIYEPTFFRARKKRGGIFPSRISKFDKCWQHVFILQENVEISGLKSEIGILSFDSIYLLNNSNLSLFLLKSIENVKKFSSIKNIEFIRGLFYMIYEILTSDESWTILQNSIDELAFYEYYNGQLSSFGEMHITENEIYDRKELYYTLKTMSDRCFNPSAWRRDEV